MWRGVAWHGGMVSIHARGCTRAAAAALQRVHLTHSVGVVTAFLLLVPGGRLGWLACTRCVVLYEWCGGMVDLNAWCASADVYIHTVQIYTIYIHVYTIHGAGLCRCAPPLPVPMLPLPNPQNP